MKELLKIAALIVAVATLAPLSPIHGMNSAPNSSSDKLSPKSEENCIVCLEKFTPQRIRVRFDCTQTRSLEEHNNARYDISITHDMCAECVQRCLALRQPNNAPHKCPICRQPLQLHRSIEQDAQGNLVAHEYPTANAQQKAALLMLTAALPKSRYPYKPRQEVPLPVLPKKQEEPLITDDVLRLSCEMLSSLAFGLLLSTELTHGSSADYVQLQKKRRCMYAPLFFGAQKLMKKIYPARAVDWRTYAAWCLGAAIGFMLPPTCAKFDALLHKAGL